MAVRVWVGTDATNIGEWNEDDNWVDGAGVGSVAPVADDDVYFVSGSQDVQADTVADLDALDSLNFGTKWTGSFVTDVNPTTGVTDDSTLAVAAINADVLNYANKIGAVGLDGTFPTVNVQATSTDSPALKLDNCAITTLNITGGSGTVLLAATTTVTGGINVIGADALRLEIEPSTVVSTADITMDSGRIVCSEQIDTAVLYGGTLEMTNVDGTSNSITIYKGNCKYKPTGAAVLTTLTMYGGFFDMRGCNSTSHTITNTTLHAGSMLDERNGLSNTIYTNPISLDGIIKCDFGRVITVT